MPEPEPPRDARSVRLRAWLDYPTAGWPASNAAGSSVYFLSDRSGLPQAYRIRPEGGTPSRFAAGSSRVGAVRPAPEGDRVMIATDSRGDERWALSAFGDDGALLRAVTQRPDRIHEPGAWRDGHRYVFRSNERDVRFFDIYEVDLDRSSPPEPIRVEDALVAVVAARSDRLLLVRSTTNIDRDLILVTGAGETLLNPHTGEEAVFDADLTSEGVYAATNPGREYAALYRFGPRGSNPERIAEFPGDLERVSADSAGRSLALVVNDRGYSRLYRLELETGAMRPVVTPDDGVVSTVEWMPYGERLLFDLSTSSRGSEILLAEGSKVARPLTVADRPLPGAACRPTLGQFPAEDGLVVPYWEYRPEKPPRATVVHVHGGPEAQARPRFWAVIPFLVNEGFRVIEPNVRGSSGYGRTYLHLDDRRLRMDSVRDLRDLVRTLRERDPGMATGRHPIGVLGGSYGGSMVLSALTTYPELFDAGVDVVGISNFITFLERTGPWRRRVREDEYGSLERDREFLRSISPLFRADRIRAPLLVVHGANDPRVPLYEAEQIVDELRRRGVPVEFLRFDDEGHGLARRENQVRAYARAAEFLLLHLMGPG